jgi:hypothetical protein
VLPQCLQKGMWTAMGNRTTKMGMGSSVEAWAKRVPWRQLEAVAEAVSVPDAGGADLLRVVAGLSGEQLDAVCQVVAEVTVVELSLQVETLKKAFGQIYLARQEAMNSGAKFQVNKASAGTIEDFHGGLGGRVGE